MGFLEGMDSEVELTAVELTAVEPVNKQNTGSRGI
jgi:hypothetical protein